MNVNSFLVKHSGKCLGYLWSQNISSTNMIEERILKACSAFFQFESISVFQGDLNPTSISSIVECCVYPVLLFGVENWIMSQISLYKLENFQGEIAKRILKFPKWFSNTAAKIILGWPSMHSICTIKKLKFLSRVVTIEDSISCQAFCSLTNDIESLFLVRECRELQERYSVDYTSVILALNPKDRQSIVKDLTHAIQQRDQALPLQSASDMEYLGTITSVVKWRKLWDHALEYGRKGITSVRNLVRVISHPSHAPSPYPLCDINELTAPLAVHVLENHTNCSESWDSMFNSILNLDPSVSDPLSCFKRFF